MTPDEPSAAPRKRSWKRWIVVLACVVAVVTIALLASAPKKEPVKVWFVRSLDVRGGKRLLFEGTNGMAGMIVVFVGVGIGTIGEAKTPLPMRTGDDWTPLYVKAETNLSFTLASPQKGISYTVMWGFHRLGDPATRWERLRTGCYDFFATHGMHRLAHHFLPRTEMHYIPSTEIKE